MRITIVFWKFEFSFEYAKGQSWSDRFIEISTKEWTWVNGEKYQNSVAVEA